MSPSTRLHGRGGPLRPEQPEQPPNPLQMHEPLYTYEAEPTRPCFRTVRINPAKDLAPTRTTGGQSSSLRLRSHQDC